MEQETVGIDILDELKRKAALAEWDGGKRKEHFILFSRSGFTDALRERAQKEGVY